MTEQRRTTSLVAPEPGFFLVNHAHQMGICMQREIHRNMGVMQVCPTCHRSLPEINRFCTQCGQRLDAQTSAQDRTAPHAPTPEQLSLNVLYGMVGALMVAVLFPPWETPPAQPPEFLGIHFFLSPPTPEAIVSRMLLTIELTTITIAGLYAAFFFRRK